MSDINNAAAPGGGEGEAAPITAITPADEKTYRSVSEAARALNAERRIMKAKAAQAAQVKPVEPARAPQEPAVAEPPKELAGEANAAPPDAEVPSEATPEIEPAEQLPPIEPPRSWTKEAKERWQSLPRETQEYLAEREQERDREVRRSQNDAAEKLKGLTAKEQAVEQARQEYEQALPALLQTLHQQQLGQFSDVKTMEDVNKLAVDDPFRFAQWQARQMQIAAVAEEAKKAQERQASEFKSRWVEFAREQDAKVAEFVPEIADPEKARKIADGGLSLLKEIGFSESEIPKLWNGEASISLRDHRLQRLLIDGVRYREAKATAAKPAPKPVPPVQRPGVPQPKSAADDAQIQALSQKLERTGSLKDAQALRAAQLKARRS